jgi:hypothetical protein
VHWRCNLSNCVSSVRSESYFLNRLRISHVSKKLKKSAQTKATKAAMAQKKLSQLFTRLHHIAFPAIPPIVIVCGLQHTHNLQQTQSSLGSGVALL